MSQFALCIFTHHGLYLVIFALVCLFVCFLLLLLLSLLRILMSMWIFLVFSSFRQLLCASHCGTLQSDDGPWITLHNFSTFSSRIYFWREREWYEWYCDRTSIQFRIEYDSVISHYFRVAACAIFHLYHGDWGNIPPRHLHPSSRLCGVITQKTAVLFTSGCRYIRVKNMSQLISTYNLCQGCCYSVIMAWVLGSFLRLFNNAVFASVVVRAELMRWDTITKWGDVWW